MSNPPAAIHTELVLPVPLWYDCGLERWRCFHWDCSPGGEGRVRPAWQGISLNASEELAGRCLVWRDLRLAAEDDRGGGAKASGLGPAPLSEAGFPCVPGKAGENGQPPRALPFHLLRCLAIGAGGDLFFVLNAALHSQRLWATVEYEQPRTDYEAAPGGQDDAQKQGQCHSLHASVCLDEAKQHRKSTDSHGINGAGSEADTLPDDHAQLRTELEKCVAMLGDMETEMAELLRDKESLRRECMGLIRRNDALTLKLEVLERELWKERERSLHEQRQLVQLQEPLPWNVLQPRPF